MFSRRPSAGADFILLFTSGNLFDNERPVGCGSVVDARCGQRGRGEGGGGGGLSLERRYAGRGQTFDTVRTNEGKRSLLLRLSFSFQRFERLSL